MNKFVSSMLGSFVGTWIAFLVFGIVIFISGLIMVASMSLSTMKNPTVKVADNSVLCIDLNGEITERPTNLSLQEYINDIRPASNLHDILTAIERAKTDSRISGIYVHCGGTSSTGFATAKSIRDALQSFKSESGKWIYAYGETIGETEYYISSVADSIYLNPVGALDIHGFMAVIPFYKGLLDKIGVEMQIIRVGTFKSAVEPYMLSSMSDANRLQTQTYIDNLWDNVCDSISSARGISKQIINEYADSLMTFSAPEIAVKEKFIDGLCYDHEFESKIKDRIDIPEDDDINYVSVSSFINTKHHEIKSNNKIAVLYAVGDINVSGSDNGINSDDLVPIILDLAKDDAVNGLVLRVNSPGGSAYASEQIWEALEQFKKSGKPFAVSMGDYAASGGYYISCGAQRIFAEPTTITGSIGIFAMVPNFNGLLTDKLGINTNFVTTNANSDISVIKALSPAQTAALQGSINRGYELFTSRCATGRGMEIDKLKSIAEGRVWDATEAKKIGLVDEFGNLDDAVKWVADKAGIIDDYSVDYLPEFEEDFMNLLYAAFSESYYKTEMKKEYGMLYEYIEKINTLLKQDQIQCRMENVFIK